MKVEFIVNADINDGRQIFIQESEFRKAKIMRKSIIVLHLLLIVYLLSMATLMISLIQMNMKKILSLSRQGWMSILL